MTLRRRLTGAGTAFGKNDRTIKFQGTHKGGEKHGHKNHAKAVKADQRPHQKALLQLCVDGNCLLLDDGEEHACVQCISRYGIYCNYFKNAVLPADRELFAEIMQPASKKQCKICKSYFVSKAKNQRYCPDCAAVQKRKKAAERQRRKQAVQSQAGFRTES